jgi:hypothetical protein
MTVLWLRAGWAQESSRTYRLGILSGGETRQASSWAVFFDEMGKAGFVEGKNLIVDWRFVGSPNARSPRLECVRRSSLRVDLG